MAKSIQTTGQLREFLANMLVGIKNGDLDPDKAGRITKMAAQIHESFYSEVKVKRTALEAQESVYALGELPINKNVDDSRT